MPEINAKPERVVIISFGITEKDARTLMRILQNPIHGHNLEEEDAETERKLREAIVEAIDSQL